MWLILQQKTPDDFVLSTNKTHSVREFVEKAFKLKGFNIIWKGSGIDEIGIDLNTGRELINVDSQFFRPAEVELLLGDSSKAHTILKWEPYYDNLDKLIDSMLNE